MKSKKTKQPKSKITTTDKITREDNVLRATRKVTFGGEGLPLSQMGRLTDLLKAGAGDEEIRALERESRELCPCGSGKKFTDCCGR